VKAVIYAVWKTSPLRSSGRDAHGICPLNVVSHLYLHRLFQSHSKGERKLAGLRTVEVVNEIMEIRQGGTIEVMTVVTSRVLQSSHRKKDNHNFIQIRTTNSPTYILIGNYYHGAYDALWDSRSDDETFRSLKIIDVAH